VEIKHEEKETKPPGRYSQGTLIKKMEELGLGTKSTRHEIINKLISRGYIDKKMVPSKVSFVVVDTLAKHCKDIVSEKMTAKLEKEMDKIEKGEVKMEDVVDESRKMLMESYEKLASSADDFHKSMEEKIGDCPKCGKEMVVVRTKKGKRFALCKSCGNTYPLPAQGVLEGKGKCPKCGAPVVELKVKGKGRKKGYEMVFCINPSCSYREYSQNVGATSEKSAMEKKQGKKEVNGGKLKENKK
jgi:DNA topoisomerase-1